MGCVIGSESESDSPRREQRTENGRHCASHEKMGCALPGGETVNAKALWREGAQPAEGAGGGSPWRKLRQRSAEARPCQLGQEGAEASFIMAQPESTRGAEAKKWWAETRVVNRWLWVLNNQVQGQEWAQGRWVRKAAGAGGRCWRPGHLPGQVWGARGTGLGTAGRLGQHAPGSKREAQEQKGMEETPMELLRRTVDLSGERFGQREWQHVWARAIYKAVCKTDFW